MSGEEGDKIDVLRDELHELKRIFEEREKNKPSWLARNQGIFTFVLGAVVAGALAFFNLRERVVKVESDASHHEAQAWHPGMQETTSTLARVETALTHLQLDLSEVKAEVSDLKKKLAN